MKRTLRVIPAILAFLLSAHAFADEEPLLDFSRSGTLDPGSWMVLYLPSGRRAEPSSVALRSGALEVVVDYSRAPAGTIGAAIVAPRIEAATPGFAQLLAGKGLLWNVGVVKLVAVEVEAGGPGVSLSVVLGDTKDQESILYLGSAPVEARRLTWVNEDYVAEVRRREMVLTPIVAAEFPCLKLVAIVCTRPDGTAGRTVIRVGGVRVTFDRAFLDGEDARLALRPW